MMTKLTATQKMLKWIGGRQAYLSDGSARWGHYLEDAVYGGLVNVGQAEVFMNGRLRDIRRPLSLTKAGRAALGQADD